MPRVQYCITRRHVRSGITRAVEPEHDDDQVVPQARKQQQQPLQPQQVPQSAAALNQQQEQRQQQQMASPSAANKQTPPQLQQQLQPVKQHQVQQQQAPLGQPQQQPPLQQQQPTQQQQMRSSAATPPTPSLRQQQQQHQQQKDSNHSRREPTWLQRIVAALQHMPAALVAFVFGGLGACLLLFGWAKGSPMRKNQPYTFSMSFQVSVCKLTAGVGSLVYSTSAQLNSDASQTAEQQWVDSLCAWSAIQHSTAHERALHGRPAGNARQHITADSHVTGLLEWC